MLIQPPKSTQSTLVDILRLRASNTPQQLAYTYLRDGETDELSLEYLELDRRARRVAAWLQSHGATGERAQLLWTRLLEIIWMRFTAFKFISGLVTSWPKCANKAY